MDKKKKNFMKFDAIFKKYLTAEHAEIAEAKNTMDKKKKKYSKPNIKKIRLDAKTAVLGFCKTDSSAGPHPIFGCGGPGGTHPCSAPGS